MTNITTSYAVVAQELPAGNKILNGGTVPSDYSVISGTGGQRGLTNQQTANINTWGLTATQSITFMVWSQDGQWPFVRFRGVYKVQGTNDTIVGVKPYDCKDSCETNYLEAPLRNLAATPQVATWTQNGVQKKQSVIQGGGFDTYTFTWCTGPGEPDPALNWGMTGGSPSITPLPDGGFSVGTGEWGSGTGVDLGAGAGGWAVPTNTGTFNGFTNNIWAVTNSDNPFGNQATGLTNGFPIVWNNPDTTAARDATLKAGFNKVASQNDSIISGLIMVNQSILNQSNGGSSFTMSSNVSDAGTHSRLDKIINLMTNDFEEFDKSTVLNYYSNLYGNAVELAESRAAPVTEMLSPFEGSTDFTIPEPPESDFFQVELLPGRVFDFRPSNYLGGVFAVARSLITWILVMGYAYIIIKDIVVVFKTFGGTNQFHIPNVQGTIFGVGGNWGALLIPVLVVAGLALWAYVLAKLGVGLTAFLTGDVTTALFTNPFGGVAGAVAAGIGESTLFFPWSMFFGLAGAYLAWDLTIGFMAAFITVAIRFFIA